MKVIDVILLIVGTEVLILTFLLAATVVTQARKSGKRVQRLNATFSSLVSQALADSLDARDRLCTKLRTESVRRVFHAFLDDQLRNRSGPPAEALRCLSRQIGFTEWLIRRMSTARDELERAATAKTLARLREEAAQKTALELLESRDPAVVLAAGYAVAAFGDPANYLPVFRAVYDRTPMSLHGTAELLVGFGTAVCPSLCRLLDEVVRLRRRAARDGTPGTSASIDRMKHIAADDVAAQVVSIDLLAFHGYRAAKGTLLRLLGTSEDDEVIVHLVKALAKLGDLKAAPRLLRLLSHENWVVRSQTVQALAALGAVQAIPAIQLLESDDSPAVRTAARKAQAVLQAAPVFSVSVGEGEGLEEVSA